MTTPFIIEPELRSFTELIPLDDELEMGSLTEESSEEVSDASSEEFSCPVCYNDGTDSGLVIPAKCSHKICLHIQAVDLAAQVTEASVFLVPH